jgi:hypothetical protein
MLPRQLLSRSIVLLVLLAAGCSENRSSSAESVPDPQPRASGYEQQLMQTTLYEDAEGLVPVRMHPAEPQTPPFTGKSASSVGSQLDESLKRVLRESHAGNNRQASWEQSDLQQDGSAFDSLLPYNNVEIDQQLPAVVNFMPSYGGGQGSLDDLAYAMYRLPLDDYALSGLEQTVSFEFVVAPTEKGNLWIGLADVNKQAWTWFPYEEDGVISIGSFSSYEMIDGNVLMVLIGLGQETFSINQILIGLFEARATGDEFVPFPKPVEMPHLPLAVDLAVDLSPECAPVNDQGFISSCTAFAVADSALNYELGQLYPCWDFQNLRNLCAPRFVYNQTGTDFSLGCPSQGRVTMEVCEWLVFNGAASEFNVPYGSRETALYDCSNSWTAAALVDADLLRPSGWHFIGEADEFNETFFLTNSQISHIKSLLLFARKVVVLRTLVDFSFGLTNYAAGESWTYSGPGGSGHAMAIVGYDDDLNGGSFKVRNSWGPNFGDDGYCYITYESLKKLEAGAYALHFDMEYSQEVEDTYCEPQFFLRPKAWKAVLPFLEDKVVLSWEPPPGVDGFAIYRDLQTSNPIGFAGPDDTTFEDLTLQDYNSHVYWIKAIYSNGDSDFSHAVFAWRTPPPFP